MKTLKLFNNNSVSFLIIAFLLLSVSLFQSCQEKENILQSEQLMLEESTIVDEFWKDGYVELSPKHPYYLEILDKLDDGVDNRSQTCGWRGGGSISCDGGRCTVFALQTQSFEADMPSACIVCIGGSDHGNNVCN